MKEFKGTPGPWRVISSGVHVVAKDGDSGSVVVLRTAKLGAIGDEPQQCIDRWEADAKLAAAAPDLLEALQEIESWDWEQLRAMPDHVDWKDALEAVDLARYATAKALGEDHG